MYVVLGSAGCNSHITGIAINFKFTLKKETQDEHQSRRQNPQRNTKTQDI